MFISKKSKSAARKPLPSRKDVSVKPVAETVVVKEEEPKAYIAKAPKKPAGKKKTVAEETVVPENNEEKTE